MGPHASFGGRIILGTKWRKEAGYIYAKCANHQTIHCMLL